MLTGRCGGTALEQSEYHCLLDRTIYCTPCKRSEDGFRKRLEAYRAFMVGSHGGW